MATATGEAEEDEEDDDAKSKREARAARGRALVEARSQTNKSGVAIQIPKTAPRNPVKQSTSPDNHGFSAEAASNAIGL